MAFDVTLVDPPWWTPGGQMATYDMVRDKDMAECIQSQPNWAPGENSALFMWTINGKVPVAVDVVQSLGATWLSMLTWDKQRKGYGRYFMSESEHLVFARFGKLVMPHTPWGGTMLRERATQHSKKPACVHERIEGMPFQTRAELFARRRRDGWSCSGNQLE